MKIEVSQVKKGRIVKQALSELGNSSVLAKKDLDSVSEGLVKWLEKQDDKDAVMLCGNKNYTAAQLIEEINNQTDFGKRTVSSMIKLTISLLFRGKESI
jgi:hypothetical protein